MNDKSLKQLQSLEKRKKEKVKKLNDQLKEEKAVLAKIAKEIMNKKKTEAMGKKSKARKR